MDTVYVSCYLGIVWVHDTFTISGYFAVYLVYSVSCVICAFLFFEPEHSVDK